MSFPPVDSRIHGNIYLLLYHFVHTPTFLQVQTGDPGGTGAGGQSYWGTPFRDEYDLKGAAKHDSRGIVAMANKGAGTNGYVCVQRKVFTDANTQNKVSVVPHVQSDPTS